MFPPQPLSLSELGHAYGMALSITSDGRRTALIVLDPVLSQTGRIINFGFSLAQMDVFQQTLPYPPPTPPSPPPAPPVAPPPIVPPWPSPPPSLPYMHLQPSADAGSLAGWVVAAVSSSVALLVLLCLYRLRRRAQFLRASRDRAEISLNMLEHQSHHYDLELSPNDVMLVPPRPPSDSGSAPSIPPGPPSSSGKPSSSSGASSSGGRSGRPGFLVDPATSDAASDRLSSVDGDNSDRPAFNLPTVVEESRHQSGRSVAGFMRSRTRWIPLQNLVGGRRPTTAGASQGDSVHWSMNASSESDSAAERASARAARNASGPFHPFQLYRGYFSGIGSSSSSSSSSDPGRLPPRKPRKRFVESPVQQAARASSSAPPTCRASGTNIGDGS